MTQALGISNGKLDKADNISKWFNNFDDLLKQIFDDESVSVDFDEDTLKFSIVMDGKEKFDFEIPGVVLIDEIETHLHLELQRNIMGLLTTIFPNIQFVVSSHSPFILNSLENVVIYNLEKKICVKNGMADIPYSGIVEGYFKLDELSNELRDKFEEYKELAGKSELSDDDYERITELEMYLDEIQDYLALKISTEYQKLKIKIRAGAE